MNTLITVLHPIYEMISMILPLVNTFLLIILVENSNYARNHK